MATHPLSDQYRYNWLILGNPWMIGKKDIYMGKSFILLVEKHGHFTKGLDMGKVFYVIGIFLVERIFYMGYKRREFSSILGTMDH